MWENFLKNAKMFRKQERFSTKLKKFVQNKVFEKIWKVLRKNEHFDWHGENFNKMNKDEKSKRNFLMEDARKNQLKETFLVK